VSVTVELILRGPEAAAKHGIGAVVGARCPDELDTSRTSREMVARMLIDWAATFGALDVTVHGPQVAEHQETEAAGR
jgi:hypothetical protein